MASCYAWQRMRVASVSDVHLDYKVNRELFVKMAAEIGARRPDAVLVVGDVSHIDALIASSIRILAREAEHVAYVPGNHDLWVDRPWEELLSDPDFDTWKRHDEVLKTMVESVGGHYLPSGRGPQRALVVTIPLDRMPLSAPAPFATSLQRNLCETL